MFSPKQMSRFVSAGFALIGFLAISAMAAAPSTTPTPAKALQYRPVQDGIDFDRPGSDQVPNCSVKAEKTKNGIAWIVRDPAGQILRRFIDTNGDKVVDIWSYYQNGLEIYRDVDANFNGKADQFRWCHNGGTRWGIDQNEDGQIDYWQVISAEEVAEEAIQALKSKNVARFARLLLTEKELVSLGLGKTQQETIQEKLRAAINQFDSLVKEQNTITAQTSFVDFGGTRPGTIPAGTGGATRDVTVYENVAAFFETGGQHDQLSLGTMVRIADRWRLIAAPKLGDTEMSSASGQFFLTTRSNRPAESIQLPEGAPSEAETQLMAELEKVDRAVNSATGQQREDLNERRADLLEQLAHATKDPIQKAQWLSQLADTISAEVQSGSYANGLKRMEILYQRLAKEKGQEDLVAHVVYRRLAAEYGLSLQAPSADYAKIQKEWLEGLETFAKNFPNSPDVADALLQLGMAEEFAGEDEKAVVWYSDVVKRFPKSDAAPKAEGAVRRLGSVGKEMELRGPVIGGGTVDLAEYRGKVVLVQYWATWCEPCKVDMALLKELYAKYAGRGFEIIGVSLDHSADALTAYLDENHVPWQHVFEEGGLDSRVANSMGILTLPTMILVDDKGKVLHRNIHVAELSGELKQLLD